jgi:hypothetical protein
MTEEQIKDRLRSMGFPVNNQTVRPMSQKADNVLKGIALNPTCNHNTRLAALAELERRKNPPLDVEVPQTA